MNILITKSFDIPTLIFSIFKKPCEVQYLLPIINPIYKKTIEYLTSIFGISYKRVKMGKIKYPNGKNLYKIAVEKTNEEIFEIRKNVYKNSNNVFLNINNDIELCHSIWKPKAYINLLYIYKSYIESKNKKDKFIILSYWKETNKSFLFLNRLKNLITIETLRFSLNIFITILYLFYRKDKSKKEFNFKVEDLILCSEEWPKDDSRLFFRNQYVLSESISFNKNFAVIDYKNKNLYTRDKKFKIKKGNFLNYLFLIKKQLPKFKNYYFVNYKLGTLNLLRILKITYYLWSIMKNIKAQNYMFSYFSTESAAMIILSKTFNSKSFIFQGSLQGIMYPMTHSPYSSPLSFTKKNEELYLSKSFKLNEFCIKPKRMKYPYNSILERKRIDSCRRELKNKFELTIGYFDGNYPSESKCENSYYFKFYEDLKEDIKLLLKFVKLFPKVAIISKSKFIPNGKNTKDLLSLIENDSELKDLYNPKNFFSFSEKSLYSDRNLISPREVGQIVDITICSTNGGTSAYEASSVGCRTVLFRSGMSAYEDLLPPNVLFESLEEILIQLSKIKANRDYLANSDLGLLDIHSLD